ncbi:non-ribosomal peptide synthetase [Xenorhabdus bovienii]|uniref:non-ribosomal peptide synthetase n=1 Tax=Xenorhabdus bovienii TaxID=40576 RepID=UPI00237C8A18|nr:non-ribosomal peptide synthetase [Xenorhabdus bovienii]MDE1482946.1 amino acid adenylation domain-containing protein [Xenorhabdus bovienii]
MNDNELISLPLAERKRLLELAKAAKLTRQQTQKTEIHAQPRDGNVPLSWAQQRLWFLTQLDPAAQTAYHMSAGLNLQGHLNQNALKAALDQIVARHEILRTTIVDVEGQPQQIIGSADSGFALSVQDLSQLPSTEQQAAVEECAQREALHPFDFTQGPLIRGHLLRLAEESHVLLLTQHHIISDGWSVNILMQELSTLYQAFCQDQADPLPALTLQYADYALWQRQWLQGDVLEKQLDYWRSELQGAPVILELPTDKPRPTQQSYAGSRVDITLPPALSTELKAFSQRHGITLFMTLLAGWAVLLSRISGQHDLVIGSPVANRQRHELEPLIGFFVNTLALRIQLGDNPSVSELLARVKNHALGAYAHQDLPFEQLVEALKPPRSLGHSPIFQVMLALDNTPGQQHFELDGLHLHELPRTRDSAYFDLTLTLNDTEQGLVGDLEYARDLFEHASIERMVGYLQTVLSAMVADDSLRIDDLPLLTPPQRTQLLANFNDTAIPYPKNALIHQLFEQQVERTPDKIALVWGETQLSYSELNQRANQLAHGIMASGVHPDDRVAICAERSLDMVIGLVGILKAGASYIPLDPNHPTERLAYMLSDSQPVLMLTQQHLKAHLPVTDIPIWALDSEEHQTYIADQPKDNIDASQTGLTPQNLAYVLYTSGSTGLPKGVMIEHQNVVHLIHSQFQMSKLTPQDRVLQFASFGFDNSVAEIFPTLAIGATVVLRPDHIKVPDTEFITFLQNQGITVVDLPTAFWHLWAQEISAGYSWPPEQLRSVAAGGEKAEYRHLLTWLSSPGTQKCRWLNTYGPTETTVNATSIVIDKENLCTYEDIPIGRPIANTRIYILDQRGQPVPIGVNGEIHISGSGVARGYLNRPELTAERFIQDPFSDIPGARMYKTGDLGRWLPDGTISYSGRNDFQVKIRGFRIELGEIEARLADCTGVKDAVVVVREDDSGDKRLVAYLIPQPGATLNAASLREQLSVNLAGYMLPSAFVTLEAFPLNQNGKIDRPALPAPDRSASVSREYAEPQGEIEQQLAEIWQNLLGLERVGRYDSFFELGGHSLLTVQVASRLRQSLNIEITLQDLFTQPVLADLAQSLVTATQSTQPMILPANREQTLPLSWTQQRLWFLAQLDPAAQTAYNMSGGLHLQGHLNQNALKAALDRIVARHEILRTTIVQAEGKARQVIGDADCGFSLTVRDLSQLPESAQQATIEECAQFEASHPFDFAQGPLIRAQLLKLGEQQHVLLLTQHHIISDGWSLNVLMNELSALYQAFGQGQADPLPALVIQYADYAVWQRQWLQGERLEKQLSYWCNELQDAPTLLELPTDKVRPPVQSYHGDQVTFTLSPELNAGLRALSQRHGATLFMTLLAGWGILLSRLSGQPDLVIGTPVANRQYSELEPLIGFFANTLALRIKLEDNPTISALLARVKAHALEAYAHQDLPFEQLVEVLQPPRSLSHSPIFQVMLALDNTSSKQSFELAELSLNPLALTRNSAHFDLTLALSDTENSLTCELEYASDLFERSSIERMAGYLQNLLAAMVADDNLRVADLPLLMPHERTQLLIGFNDTAVTYPQDKLLPQLFEQQVEHTPDAIALIWEDAQLSYTELNQRANQLAHALIAFGVQPDDRVAICIERNLDMVIGMLGILKAGAGYVPLDPEYPAERLAYILSDSAPKLLLTQQHLQARLPVADLTVWQLDDASHLNTVAPQPTDNPDPHQLGLYPHHLAYIIYTSGSTGLPKGVMIEHHNVVNFTYSQCQTSELISTDRVLQFASVSFDTAVSEIFPTLSVGATLILRPAHIRIPDATFSQFLQEQAISVVDLPTAFWHQWVQEMKAGRSGFSSHLRSVTVGGEKAEHRHFVTWQSMPETRHCRWIDTYGPTETTVIATALTLDDPTSYVTESLSIGRPLINTHVYILDTQEQPVPIGVTGEIYIGGAGVARGYLNRPELTTERFVSDPFREQPHARMYRTGDLGCWRPDGTIVYLGRNDFQVKIRGFRIELGEIESQLAACAGVSDAVVVVREEGSGDKRLVAYLVPQSDVTLDAADLREQLSTHLAEYMLPSAFVILDAFPLNPNGKLDRKALPAPDHAATVSREYQAPEGEMEQQLAVIWQALLGLEQVGRQDNFFELGGHSLLVVSLIEQLRQSSLNLDVSAVFSSPTLAAMAARLIVKTSDGSAGTRVQNVPPNLITDGCQAITPEMLPLVALTQDNIDQIVAQIPGGVTNIQDIYPLGPLQEGILFHHLLETTGDTYLDNQLMTFDSRPRLDMFLLALQQVINRHDILRSAVHWNGLPEPVQVVYRQAPLPIAELTLSPEHDTEQQLRDATDSRSVRMDLTQAPLLSIKLAKDPHSETWFLALLHHHLVCDHLSLEMIFNEVQAMLLGQDDSLSPSLPYRNFIAQTRTVPLEKHQDYFRQLLGDVDEPTLPFGLLDIQSNSDEQSEIAEANFTLDNELARKIRDCARQQGVSAAVLFHVAWAQVVAQCSGRDDVVFGTVLLGRLQGGSGADQVLGMFINTLPVRVLLQERTVRQTVQETYRQLSTLLEHEQTPLAIAQRCSRVQAPQPLFNSLLNFRHSQQDDKQSASPAWEGIQILSGEERSNYPLSLDVDDFDDGFALTAQCNRQVDPARINTFMDTVLKELVAALQNVSEQSIQSLAVLPPDERTRLLVDFNNTTASYPQNVLLHQPFEQQAERTPEAIALIWEDVQLSYAELNQRANQLAHHLISSGVQPDDRVAICIERNLDMVIGMLGILKAGAGYVPLDPAYPAERLAYILSDSAPKLLLTQQHLQERLAVEDLPVWRLDDDSHLNTVARQPTDNPDSRRLGLLPQHLAYIIYTSGSTGLPKGVMIEHRNVVNFTYAQCQVSELKSTDRVLQFASVSFDTAVSDIFPTLAVGATLILRPAHIQVPDATFSDFLREQAITIVDLPTAFWHQWVQEMKAGRSGFSSLLRSVTVGGEKAEHRHYLTWQSMPETQHCRWIDSYGPTETTVITTALALDNHTEDKPTAGSSCMTETLSIGRPIANTRIYILDARGQPVPIGVTGEIYIGGAGVARGYLNRPELTTERFVSDPFSEQPHARMYRTGDLGCWQPDGTIVYLGRNDFQVKLRGFRIELGEIETQLAACPGVKDAVVVAREEDAGDKRLVAYVIPQPDASLDAASLREQLSTHLTEYMLPSAFVILDAFPLTPSGKLDRKALPAPDRSASASHEYEAPQGEIEPQLAAIWQTLLGLEQVGRHDNFFELGGNSLSIMRLSTHLREEFHLEIPIADIFHHSTLYKLAELILSRQIETFLAQDIESVQKELENLSEEELLAMLNGDQQ